MEFVYLDLKHIRFCGACPRKPEEEIYRHQKFNRLVQWFSQRRPANEYFTLLDWSDPFDRHVDLHFRQQLAIQAIHVDSKCGELDDILHRAVCMQQEVLS